MKIFRNEVKAFECDLCYKSCKEKFILKKHMKTLHGGAKDFSCDMCKKLFREKHHLQEHIKMIHVGGNQGFSLLQMQEIFWAE